MLRQMHGVRRIALLAALTALYVISARLSLQLASTHPSASPVWPPTGIALALVLLLSVRVWPAIFFGAFLVNLATAGSLLSSLLIASGNTLEAVVGGALVARYAGGVAVLSRVADLARFALLAALLSTTLSATVGVASLTLLGFAEPDAVARIWLTWWLGNAAGALLVAPLILAWTARDAPELGRDGLVEATLIALALTATAQAVLGGPWGAPLTRLPLEFLCVPLVLWAALRFHHRGATTAVVLLAVMATVGTLHGHGPFAGHPRNTALLLLQVFLGVLAVTALIVATVVAQWRDVEGRLRHLAVSDPLTGLANYRLLVDRVHAEIARSRRTGHPFVVLFMDLDGLKRINDSLGHVTGSRSLVRVAHVLKRACRSVDLVARYGGDEFVVVLPESDDAAAAALVQRIEAAITRSSERPPLKLSFGSALHPRDGHSPEALFEAADGRLYAGRRRNLERKRREDTDVSIPGAISRSDSGR